MLKHIILIGVLSVGACSKKSQCEEVFDHTVSLLPAEMKDKVAASKSEAIGKCEKLSPEAQKCALDAKALEDLMKCPKQ
jgi:hypothetical protein